MRKLDNWIKHYLEYTRYSEAPESFHFWTAIGTIAAVLRRKVFMRELYYTWSPNFYIVFVAKPGLSTKSTALNLGKRLVADLKNIKFGPNAMTWQALISCLETAREQPIMPDGTYYPMSCLTFYASELGTLLDLNDRQMIDVLVDLWDGQEGAWDKATKTMGANSVMNPWVNIIAATTPAWLGENLPKQMLGGGFTSRCIFVFADGKRQLVAYPSRQAKSSNLNGLRANLLSDLEKIAQLRGEVTLTEEAYQFGEAWYGEHYKRILKDRDDQGGYLSRKQTHIHKLAIVLRAARGDSLVLQATDLAEADTILTALEQDMQTVFQSINARPEMEHAIRLVEVLKDIGKIRQPELYRRYFFNVIHMKDFEDAVESAIQAGHIIRSIEGSRVFLIPK